MPKKLYRIDPCSTTLPLVPHIFNMHFLRKCMSTPINGLQYCDANGTALGELNNDKPLGHKNEF